MIKIEVIKRDFNRNRYLYLMLLPVILYYIIFCYIPMYGSVIAFQQYNPSAGILHSPWVGFKHFEELFSSHYFTRTIKNTVILSIYILIFEFPASIIFALLINEINNKFFKKAVQTITYIPYFISLIVICGLIKNFTIDTGAINDLIAIFGGKRVTMLQRPELFRIIYIISDIWQNVGWGTIIYLAALANIDIQQYEAAVIDGAKRLKQLWHVTLPGLMPTIIILLILQIGNVFSIGAEKILLLYNPSIYETSDIISTFIFRKGLVELNYSFSSAVGLFNTVINFILLICANELSKKFNESSLW